MKCLKKITLTTYAFVLASSAFGQLTFSGEYRPRAEYRHGYKSIADTNQKSAFSIDQRTRLTLDYIVDDYEFYLSVQDIRTWGSNQQLNISDGFLSVHQAWAKINIKKGYSLKLGRQEIIHDDHRLFGNVAWLQQSRSHDAALFQFNNDRSRFDFGIAFNQIEGAMIGVDYSLTKSYRDMQFIHFNHRFNDKVVMSLTALNLGQQVDFMDGNESPSSSMNYTQTIGTFTKFNFDKFGMNVNAFYQMGSAPVTPVKSTSAYLFSIDASHKISDKFFAGFGYETQSGTTQTDTTHSYLNVSHNFSPYFGTNHKFNGFMDYFYVGNSHGNVGLQDIYLKLKYKKGSSFIALDAHMFLTGLGVEVYDSNGFSDALDIASSQVEIDAINATRYSDYKLSSYLGTELDLSFETKINKSVTLKAGYSHMLASETLATLKGVVYTSGPNEGSGRVDQINNWGYLMIIIKPTFLVRENKK
mgnify:CR=1 FL=1